MSGYRRLWFTLIAVLTVTFAILGVSGVEIYRKVPPIPAQVVTPSGEVLMTREDILAGQSAWQSSGGMQLGSVWGHGAYQAPDWSADWLHRELVHWLDLSAQETFGKAFDDLDVEQKARLTHSLKQEYRHNTLDAQTGVITVSERRAEAIRLTADHYDRLYGDDPALREMRDHYAMKNGTLPDPARRAALTDFFFWTSWAAATERPGTVATYTNNWPPEPLIGNQPTTENILWSLACVVILIAGVGALISGWAFLRRHDDTPLAAPKQDPLSLAALTPSQRALGKYLFVVVALFVFQVFIGGFTAHYTIEGQSFYGVDVSQWFPLCPDPHMACAKRGAVDSDGILVGRTVPRPDYQWR